MASTAQSYIQVLEGNKGPVAYGVLGKFSDFPDQILMRNILIHDTRVL